MNALTLTLNKTLALCRASHDLSTLIRAIFDSYQQLIVNQTQWGKPLSSIAWMLMQEEPSTHKLKTNIAPAAKQISQQNLPRTLRSYLDFFHLPGELNKAINILLPIFINKPIQW